MGAIITSEGKDMNIDKNIEQNEKVILSLKEKLEEEGFKTTWQDPFFAWVHDTPLDQEPLNQEYGKFYIYDPPVPKLTPFDIASVALSCSNNDHIYFELSIYYDKVLEDLIEADDINDLFDRHATEWSPETSEYLNGIAMEYSLQWDTEYDVFIEDSLYGDFPFDSIDQIVSLMKEMKEALREYEAK